MKRSEKEIKLDEKIGFGCSLKNMFVGVVKPEAYMKMDRVERHGMQ